MIHKRGSMGATMIQRLRIWVMVKAVLLLLLWVPVSIVGRGGGWGWLSGVCDGWATEGMEIVQSGTASTGGEKQRREEGNVDKGGGGESSEGEGNGKKSAGGPTDGKDSLKKSSMPAGVPIELQQRAMEKIRVLQDALEKAKEDLERKRREPWD